MREEAESAQTNYSTIWNKKETCSNNKEQDNNVNIYPDDNVSNAYIGSNSFNVYPDNNNKYYDDTGITITNQFTFGKAHKQISNQTTQTSTWLQSENKEQNQAHDHIAWHQSNTEHTHRHG